MQNIKITGQCFLASRVLVDQTPNRKEFNL
jgi:hypothetical protein